MKTIAERFSAELDNDGQRWETEDGTSFEELARRMGAVKTYGARYYGPGGNTGYMDGTPDSHFAGDPVRYEFRDGSAVVQAGPAWDIEGPERYSWIGAR